MAEARPTAVIAGVGETTFARHSERADEEWIAEAIALALQDAGLRRNQVDGLVVATISVPDDSPHIAEHLGFELRYVMKADYGGASTLAGIARARAAIEAGLADVVVVAAGGNRIDLPTLSHDRRTPPWDYSLRNWLAPFGYAEPNGLFGIIQRRHMHDYGTTLEQLGKIAVTLRAHAQLNERALLREPMTIDDYISSRLIADPIRRADCVMRCAGGAAIVICADWVAQGLMKPPIYMRSYGERVNHQTRGPDHQRTETGFVALAEQIFCNDSRSDMDFAQLYDDYPIAVLLMLEDLGFAEKGKGGTFIDQTDISIGGGLPLNTGGGQLSIGQPSLAGGAIHVVEAVHQLRGEAGERQVNGASRGLVTGIGMLSYAGNLGMVCGAVLGTEAA
ncbi:thiolase family protein [Arthrobacter sp. M4]|uniref:thiolase family protein n=1 Tax=Arthrobacter sp. M4 TaxID=218160 RepID=UPI001CDC2608|nr:thiolase family protein [Arthrobacter sp. M4]MCA4135385.1 thiolase family protein [Arthrobacter sp. M4]